MIPDNVEKIIMTKEDYDRNIEQLLYDKVNAKLEIERLNNIINKLENKIYYLYSYAGIDTKDLAKINKEIQNGK